METESVESNLAFVRYCIDGKECTPAMTDWLCRTKGWDALFRFMKEQALLGVGFQGLERMAKEGVDVPREVVLKWYAFSEQIRQRNVEMNQECARLTKLFESEGHRTAILKGQANARFYPDSLNRQSGDIDIYVNGGYEKVVSMLVRVGMVDDPNIGKYEKGDEAERAYHHVHLPTNENGIDVEVHFRPSSGVWNSFANKKLQRFLEEEIAQENELVEEGFRVPSLRFALVMQLAHIQRHFMDIGVGLRQIMDYYYLLQRRMSMDVPVEIPEKLLKDVGLWNMAKATMWLLHHLFGLEEKSLFAPMDEMRGRMLLEDIVRGGNFGHHSVQAHQNAVGRFILGRTRHVKLLRFDIMETFGFEWSWWETQAEKTVERVKRRSWSL